MTGQSHNTMPNQTAAIRILCTLGLRGVMTEIAPMLASRGIDVDASYGATNMLLGRMAEGESADVAILVDAAIDALTRRGTITAGSRRDLARSGVGVAVAVGAARPDIGTVEAFRRAMLAARSIGYSKSGASGLHFAELIVRLGIAAEVTRKAKVQDGVVGELAANGEVEIAVQQISELKLVDGIDIVGSLPDELQKLTVFSAGVFAASTQPARAASLIAALGRPDVTAVMRHKGLEPIASVV